MKVVMLDVETGSGFVESCFDFGYAGNHLELIAEAAAQQPDILLAPEYFLYQSGKAPYTMEEKEALLGQIAAIAGRQDNLIIPGTILWQEKGIVHNTAPVLIGRNKVHEHHKSYDLDTWMICIDFGLISQLGTEPGYVIDWRGKRIGLEICVEHKLGRLKQSGRGTDLHVVVGCNGYLIGNNNTARSDGRPEGYMLLCDGLKKSRVNKGSGDLTDDLPYEKQGNLFVYNIEI